MVGAVRDDHHVPVLQVHVDIGDADTVDEQRAFRTDEFDGVAGERLEVVDQPGLGLDHPIGDLRLGLLLPPGSAAVPRRRHRFVEADLRAVLDLLEQVGAGVVDQCDTAGDEHFGGPRFG